MEKDTDKDKEIPSREYSNSGQIAMRSNQLAQQLNKEVTDEELVDDDYDYEDDPDQKGGLPVENVFQRMKKYKKQLSSVQNTIGQVADVLEGLVHILAFKDPRRSRVVFFILLAVTFFLAFFPFRILLLAGGIAKWASHLVNILNHTTYVREPPKVPGSENNQGDSFVKNFIYGAPTSLNIAPHRRTLYEGIKHA